MNFLGLPAGNWGAELHLNCICVPPMPCFPAHLVQELYAKWRPTGAEGFVLRAGYQPDSNSVTLSSGIAF